MWHVSGKDTSVSILSNKNEMNFAILMCLLRHYFVLYLGFIVITFDQFNDLKMPL